MEVGGWVGLGLTQNFCLNRPKVVQYYPVVLIFWGSISIIHVYVVCT